MDILKNILLIFVTILMIMITCVSVSAEMDLTDDIWHQVIDEKSETGVSWEKYTGSKDDIDITDLSYTISDDQIIVTMSLDGIIKDGSTNKYFIYVIYSVNTTPYYAWYMNGFERISDTSVTTENIIRGGDSEWTVSFDINDPGSIVDVFGETKEFSDDYARTGEYWGDWAPDIYFEAYDEFYGSVNGNDTSDNDSGDNGGDSGSEDNNGEDDDTGGEIKDNDGNNENDTSIDGNNDSEGTSGFEIILFIAAISILLIHFKKKK